MEFLRRDTAPSGVPAPLSLFYQLVCMALVLLSLLLLRQAEKPRARRRVAVWVLDLGRLVGGYALAEALLLAVVVVTGASGADAGGADKRADEGAAASTETQLQTSMLALSALEIFPGLVFTFTLYMAVLYGGYRAKAYLKTRFRVVRDAHGSYSVRSKHSHDHDQDDQDKAWRPRVHWLSEADFVEQTEHGFVSGNYGTPVRVRWWAQQTVALACTVLLVRGGMLSTLSPAVVSGFGQAAFGWIAGIPSVALRQIVGAVVVPALFYSAHFCAADWLLRYRPNVGGKYKAFAMPVYYMLSEGSAASPSLRSYEEDEEAMFVESARSQPQGFGKSGSSVRLDGGRVTSRSRRTGMPAPEAEVGVPAPATTVPDKASDGDDKIEEEIEAMVEDLRGLGKQALHTVTAQLDRRQQHFNTAVSAGLKYGSGLVPAGLFTGGGGGRPGGGTRQMSGFAARYAQPIGSVAPAQGAPGQSSATAAFGLDSLDTDESASESGSEDDDDDSDVE